MKVAIKTSDALDQAQYLLAEQQAKVKVYVEMRQFLKVLTTIHWGKKLISIFWFDLCFQSGSLEPNVKLKHKFESIRTELTADMTAVMRWG